MKDVWCIFSRQLYFVSQAYSLKIHVFVLMENHFHLIASAPQGNLSEAMAFLLREVSREITRSSNRINQTWGGRFFRSRLGTYHYFMHAYKYVYRNPVEANLCKKVEEYKYSTLNGLLGFDHLLIPMAEDPLLFENVKSTLSWLNTAPLLADRLHIKTALKKAEFCLPKPRKNSENPLEWREY